MIFTALFFSVTFNSPANYSVVPRFCKILTSSSDTTRPGSVPAGRSNVPAGSDASGDTVPTNRPIIAHHAYVGRDTSYLDLYGDTVRYNYHPDPLRKGADTPDYKISKDTLEAQIDYKASDSIVMIIPSKNIKLYNKADAKYKDADLTADHIEYQQSRNVIVASPSRDTAGNPIGCLRWYRRTTRMQSDTITYNIKSQKGLTRNTYTHDGEMWVHAEKMKKITPEEYFGWRGVFTTCNLDTPHFAFRTNKMKIINQKMAITGPIHPEFEGVPLPLYLPFGFSR